MRSIVRGLLGAWMLSGWSHGLLAAGTGELHDGNFMTSDHVRLHYLEAGQGRPVVFVPGWTMPAAIWRTQLDDFAATHRVIALDPRSQGDSEKVAEGHTLERRARDVRELVSALRLEKPVLVGWSNAVPELLSYVDQFGTDGLSGLMLVDGVLWMDPNSAMQGSMVSFMHALQSDRASFTDRMVRSMYARPQNEEYLREIIAASNKTPTNTAVVLEFNILTSSDLRPALAKIHVPLMYIYNPYFRDQARMLKERVPSAQILESVGTGHALFVDDAPQFRKTLSGFLNGLVATGR